MACCILLVPSWCLMMRVCLVIISLLLCVSCVVVFVGCLMFLSMTLDNTTDPCYTYSMNTAVTLIMCSPLIVVIAMTALVAKGSRKMTK